MFAILVYGDECKSTVFLIGVLVLTVSIVLAKSSFTAFKLLVMGWFEVGIHIGK